MKYGINNPTEETAFDRKEVTEEEVSPQSDPGSPSSPTMAETKQGHEIDAVIFSIQFYGKKIGEVGMMDQDLSELDWKKFKSYLFQNLLTLNHQENICVSYSDEEGDKLPIESDEEYQEALKVAKRKAVCHDKMVLDITRQGTFPAMLSLVSSGIKKVSSSPPKEGGISFFKASSPPKDTTGFKPIGAERKLFQGFFMPDKGNERSTGARPKDARIQGDWSEQPPEWFTTYMGKFRTELCQEISQRVLRILKDDSAVLNTPEEEPESLEHKLPHRIELGKANFDERPLSINSLLTKNFIGPDNSLTEEVKKKETEKEDFSLEVNFNPSDTNKAKKKDDKTSGVKRKKFVIEEERLLKKQEKIERKKLILTSKYADEMDKASRTQEKVFAKMEGLRKKQFCSQEELNKIRKMVDKQQRFITSEQRQQRRNERKAGYQKLGKSKKINIDNKGFPVDASLLHAALQELEALAEDSTSDCAGGLTTRGYDALYLNDITYPDGSVVNPGKEFVKTWRVANNGVVPWNEKTTLCKWSQVRFRGSPAGWKLKPSMKRVVCPPLKPGQEGDISITFTAPSEPGWYATHWRFCQRGRVFGNQMWCAIRVEEEQPSATGMYKPQLGKTVIDENGVTKRLFSTDDMQELKAAMLPQPIIKNTYFLKAQEPPASTRVPLEELGPQNDLGIIENYYDAEDPVQRDCTEGLQKLILSWQDELEEESSSERKERDLISFEEEAEVVDSGASTPEIIPSVSQGHFVVPLKEMAKESVESLIIKDQVLLKDQVSQLQPTEESCELIQPDSISMSSGSFSELDSEDQAILNESDSEGSDHEYYVVRLPDCFNTSSIHDGLSKESESSTQANTVVWREGTERVDSPDFLTADEDDRTTAVASDSSEDLTCSVNDHNYACNSSSVSRTSSGSSLRCENSKRQMKSTSVTRSIAEGDEEIDGQEIAKVSSSTTLPAPPISKPFMSIPNEAIQTNIPVSSGSNDPTSSSQIKKDQDPGTWASGATNVRSVVCEQPYSAQHKDSKEGALSQDGANPPGNESTITSSSHSASQLPVDLVGALPDELVSIIPEDLVRGAWNTARSFITRINQEMLSPTADAPGRVYACEEECPSDLPQPPMPPPPSSVQEAQPQQEEAATQEVTSTTSVSSEGITVAVGTPDAAAGGHGVS